MNNEQRGNYARMNKLLQELDGLNKNIARLTFHLIYGGGSEHVQVPVEMLNEQSDVMKAYRSVLIDRLDKGGY